MARTKIPFAPSTETPIPSMRSCTGLRWSGALRWRWLLLAGWLLGAGLGLPPASAAANVAAATAGSEAAPAAASPPVRILIVAPHPDDEAIPLGGWLYDMGAAGHEVWAVVITDGARFPRAIRARTIRPVVTFGPRDFRRLGRLRRSEANRSLAALGVPRERRIFLGYPSGGLDRLQKSPRPDALLRCVALGQRYGVAEWGGADGPVAPRATGVSRRHRGGNGVLSPLVSDGVVHAFSRAALTADLARVLALSRPDIVCLPCDFDSNADHRATTVLMREALAAAGLQPELRGYLVHRGGRRQYPRLYGYRPEREIDDPPDAPGPPPQRYHPTPAGLAAKERALRAHRSQIRLKDGFLLSFVRKSELWWDLRADRPAPTATRRRRRRQQPQQPRQAKPMPDATAP